MPIASSGQQGLLAWAASAAEGAGRTRARELMPPEETHPPDERNQADAGILRRMAAGDRDALAELYGRFSRPLYSASLQILHDAAESQDVVHDVFITLWEKATLFETGRGTAFSWATSLVRNRAIDRLRTRRRRAELLEQSVLSDLGYGEPPEDSGGAAVADLRHRAQTVRAAVSTLPPEQQRALELAFFSGLTQQEIAERLHEPLGTIKARIRRGLAKLRDSLANRL